jgi:hypothetical protein
VSYERGVRVIRDTLAADPRFNFIIGVHAKRSLDSPPILNLHHLKELMAIRTLSMNMAMANLLIVTIVVTSELLGYWHSLNMGTEEFCEMALIITRMWH